MTAYDGQTISYDGSGNPTSYYNGTRWAFTWEEGRRLTYAAANGKGYTYTYDSNGIRTSKTVNGVTHSYIYASGKLLRETYGNVTLDFLYDNLGYPYALIYKNGTAAVQTYYYITNLQGDVLYLLDSAENVVAAYEYSPYGEVTTTVTSDIAEINPLRYRGYYYDTETDFYYVSSRYYDAAVCRFINADNTSLLGVNGDISSYNLFAYCGNNPIARVDNGGGFWNFVIGAVVGAVVGAVTTAVDIVRDDGWDALKSGKTWAKMGVSAVCGAINGAVAASGVGTLDAGVIGGVTGFVESLGHELIDNDGKMDAESWENVATDTAAGFLGGLSGGSGAIKGDKYMLRQTFRFLDHAAEDGIKKAGSFFFKMTAKYSKQFVTPTLAGLAKGWVGGRVAGDLLALGG